MSDQVRLLALVPKAVGEDGLDALLSSVSKSLEGILDPGSFTLTSSFKWYRDRFEACGSWEGWIWESVSGKDYATRNPHFNGFVACSDRLGRANAGIAELALRSGKVVFYWEEGSPIRFVNKVTQVKDDWKDGWQVESSSIGV